MIEKLLKLMGNWKFCAFMTLISLVGVVSSLAVGDSKYFAAIWGASFGHWLSELSMKLKG